MGHCDGFGIDPPQTGSTWEPQARQGQGGPSPGSGGLSSFVDHPPRALERSSQDQATRFPVELHRGASQPRPALHEWHQMLAQESCGTRSIFAPTAEAVENLPRGARCFPRNHEEKRHLLTPLPQGCIQLWTSVARWRSAVHRVMHNGGQSPLSTLACVDGTGSTPRCGLMRGCGGNGRRVRPHRVHRPEMTHAALMADPRKL